MKKRCQKASTKNKDKGLDAAKKAIQERQQKGKPKKTELDL